MSSSAVSSVNTGANRLLPLVPFCELQKLDRTGIFVGDIEKPYSVLCFVYLRICYLLTSAVGFSLVDIALLELFGNFFQVPPLVVNYS